MAIKLADAFVKIFADDSQLQRDYGEVRRSTNVFAGFLQGIFQGVGQEIFRATSGAIRNVVGVVGEGIQSFVSFQNQMNEVFTLLPGISQRAMGQMTEQVKDFAREFGVLPEQVVPALYQALSAGVPPDNVFEFLATAQKAAVGGVSDLTTSVDGLSSVTNAYGRDILSAAEASDVMFTTVRLGKTNFDQLSDSLFQVIPTAASLGVEFGNVGAALAAMTAQGTPTAVATTQLRQLLVELSKEGSKTAEVFEQVAGQSFVDFIASGRNLQDALVLLERTAENNALRLSDLFSSVEAGNAALSLTGRGAESFTSALQQMENSTGATQSAFETMETGIAGSVRRIQADWATFILDIGETLGPLVGVFADTFEELMPQMTDWGRELIISFADGLADFIIYITPTLIQLRDLFAYWLAPGSPPRLLPDITKWGRGAIQAYLDGFKAPNVRAALDNVGKGIEGVLRSFASVGKIKDTDIFERVFGSRQAIERAAREFIQSGRVTSETMANIIRNAGPAGSSVAGLVRAYFDLQRASNDVAKAQEGLNRVTEQYDKVIDPLRERLSANQGQQQEIRDNQRIAGLRDDIADAAQAQTRAEAAAKEIEAIRLKQRLATNQTWFEQVQDAERIAELEREIADASAKQGTAELARLEIQEIKLQQQIEAKEKEKEAAQSVEQQRLEAARQAEDAARAALENEQAVIDLQLERNRLIAEEMRLQEDLEAQRLAAIQKLADEQKRAAEEAKRELERQQREEGAVQQAQFEYEFSIADTPQKLELLKDKLADTEKGTVDYFRILAQLSQLQKQYAKELAKVPYDEAAEQAKKIAEAQFQYQFAIADTAGKLALLNDRLEDTTTGSVEYYQLLTQIDALQKQYAREQERANEAIGDGATEAERAAEAQFNYQLAIADTAGKIELLTGKLAGVQEGSAEYYRIQTQLFQLQEQLAREQERAAAGLDESSRAAEQAAEAQFNYQLSIADTAGKIELLNQKLADVEVGSAEYYRILTQLAGLQEQYNQELSNTDASDAAAEAQFAYQLAIADTAGKIELLTGKLATVQEGSAEYYRILTQLAGLQERYNQELENTTGSDAATDAQFAYQFSIADTAGKLELLRQKLAETEEGTAEYYQTLTQISALEKQYQSDIEGVTDAQFAYQLAIASTPEKIALLQQALAGTTEGSEEYFRTLTQISQLEAQYQGQLESDARRKAAEDERTHQHELAKAEQETERVKDAQFRYALALADTSGKIELYKQKLLEVEPESAEYYDLLIKIRDLEERHNDELLLVAGNLDTVRQKSDDLAGANIGLSDHLRDGLIAKTSEGREATDKLSEALGLLVEAMNTKPTELDPNMKAAVDNFNRLTEEIGLTIGVIGDLLGINLNPLADSTESATRRANEAWQSFGGAAGLAAADSNAAAESTASETARIFGQLAENLAIIRAGINGDWAEMWRLFKEQTERDNPEFLRTFENIWIYLRDEVFQRGFVDVIKRDWPALLGFLSNVGEFLQPMIDAGSNILGSLLAGLTDNWWRVTEWFRTSLQWIRDQLPFSEPADSSSPLRGMADAGRALLGGFLDGLQGKWGEVSSWWSGKLQWLKDQLPGSEPKDASSPLRGLTKTGKALVEMVQTGIDQASFSIEPLAGRLMMEPASMPAMPMPAMPMLPPEPPAPVNQTNTFAIQVDVTIKGNADEDVVRRGAETGVINAVTQLMRQMGQGV